MRLNILLWQILALLASSVLAQDIAPFNLTGAINTTTTIDLNVYAARPPANKIGKIQMQPVISAASSQIPPMGIQGTAILGTPEVVVNLSTTDIVLIPCDPSEYSGNIGASQLFTWVTQRGVSAIILYSRESNACKFVNYTQAYSRIYTLQNSDDARDLLGMLSNTTSAMRLHVSIDSVANSPSHTTTSSGPAASQSSTPSSASTTVAMIVLYSITGVITALFLSIIVTGALRAHRHPERYGPRAVIGLPRRSRAKGLAKAILDSLPIVKFGEREAPKHVEHELESARNVSSITASQTIISPDTAENTQNHDGEQSPSTHRENISPGAGEEAAIASAALGAATITTNPETADAQGCSICTEDFELGQDQRVLPCDHRFHPACVDPWLLNVSGTCPLCRIDLRPAQSADEPENGDEDLAPPLTLSGGTSAADGERRSRRRSVILSMLGVPRPERLTREQRLQALREYRLHHRRQHTASDTATESGPSNT